MSQLRQVLFSISLGISIGLLASCEEGLPSVSSGGSTGGSGGTGDTGSQNNGNGNTTPPGKVDDNAGFYVKVYNSDEESYWEHKAGNDFSAPCVVMPSDTTTDIQCIVDIPEKDLFDQGIRFQYNVPRNMCTYLEFLPYYYENWHVAAGPLAGQTVNVYVNGAAMGSAPGVGGVPTGALPAGLNADGTPADCSYDYSKSIDGAPNCCMGQYTINTYTWDPDSSAYGTPSVNLGDYGGDPATCIDGPALKTQKLSKDGFPTVDSFYIANTGLNKTYEPTKPIDEGFPIPWWSVTHADTSVWLANYYTGFDTGSTPAGLSVEGYAQESYEWICEDRAREVQARIRMYVREWNSLAEWQKKDLGDPDTTGSETNYPGSTRFMVGDFNDWDNFEALAGISKYPMNLH